MSIDILEELIDKKTKEELTPPQKEVDQDKMQGEENIAEKQPDVKEKITSKEDNKQVEEKSDDKQVKSLEKALNDTKKSYQNANQKLVLAKKNFNKLIDELKEDQLSENNVLVEKDQYENIISRLRGIFDIKEEELEAKGEEPKEENKSKNILSKLESEFEVYKKYNKSKDLEANYKAFFESVHLLNVEERQDIIEYLEEADSSDAIEKILLMGKDYRELFEDGIKKHKHIFGYVSNLHEQISKLNEEINKYKLSVDNSFDKSDNKQIKHRTSPIEHSRNDGDDLLSYIMNGK